MVTSGVAVFCGQMLRGRYEVGRGPPTAWLTSSPVV